MTLERGDGTWSVSGSWYRLRGTDGGLVARLDDASDRPWAELRLLASVDPVDGAPDETLGLSGPELLDGPAPDQAADGRRPIRLSWELRSSSWRRKRLVLEADADELTAWVEVEGDGGIGSVSLLAGRAILPRVTGRLMSGAWFESIVSGGPADPGRLVSTARESAEIGVVSGSEPGRGAWFFTPGPFVFAASRAIAADPIRMPPGPWLAFGLVARTHEAGFTSFRYLAQDRGFGFALDYEGKTEVAGSWRSPSLVIASADDPYAAIGAWRDALAARGLAPGPPAPATVPGWWLEPMFCGWGAQAAIARAAGRPFGAAPGEATQANYDRFLGQLEGRGIRPGTVVVDDKWQIAYGTCEPDRAKWPDLAGWIRGRHDVGQRVLLWYKAWDPEGVPEAWCVRSRDGTPLGIDPTHPDGEAAIRRAVRRMLGEPDVGLGADGLKIDFTARTPSGTATTHHGPEWGVDLARRLLEVVADEARRVRPDVLLIGQAPNPLTVPFQSMIRLNDALRLDDPRPIVDLVASMRHRAAIVRAACPGIPIDTDDWCVPDRAQWRAYAAAKPALGVPALYYVDRLDLSLEPLTDDDAALIRKTWAAYRATLAARRT